jgi:hypothetical protein
MKESHISGQSPRDRLARAPLWWLAQELVWTAVLIVGFVVAVHGGQVILAIFLAPPMIFFSCLVMATVVLKLSRRSRST